jgi:ribonuclease P protein component
VYRFDKALRLSDKKEYDYVFAQATKTMTQELILLHRKNSLGHARIGLALSKKMIARANQRNRVKRIIRESFRTGSLPAVDIVVLARPGIAKVQNSLINANLSHAWEKLTACYAN